MVQGARYRDYCLESSGRRADERQGSPARVGYGSLVRGEISCNAAAAGEEPVFLIAGPEAQTLLNV